MQPKDQQLKKKQLKGSKRENKRQARLDQETESTAQNKSADFEFFEDIADRKTGKKPSSLPKSITLKDGTLLEGVFREPGLLARGKKTLTDGTTLEGTFVNNLLCGQCKKVTPDGTIYEGHFENDFLEGVGRKTDKWNQVSYGTFKKDKLNGKGTHRSQYFLGNYCNNGNERYYERLLAKGNFKDDLLDGEGEELVFRVTKFYSTKNGKYSETDDLSNLKEESEKIFLYSKQKGTYLNGQLSGEGYYEDSIASVQGHFVRGSLNGLGSKVTYKQTVFDSSVHNSQKVQETMYSDYHHLHVWRDSSTIRSTEKGTFINGVLNGKGKIVSDGKTWEGSFNKGRLDGKGLHISESQKMEGIFSDGEFVKGTLEFLVPISAQTGYAVNGADGMYVKYPHFTKNKKGVKVGTVFQGTFENTNQIRGHGVVTVPGEGEFEGDFLEGKMIGDFKKLK